MNGIAGSSQQKSQHQVLVYSELWTAGRVWLVISSPPGVILDLGYVEVRKSGNDDIESSPHALVAEAARELLEPHMQRQRSGRIHLMSQTGELGHELKPWVHAGQVTLKAYTCRSLVSKFQRQANRLLDDFDTDFGTRLRSVFEAEDPNLPRPAERLLNQHAPYLAQLLHELREMEGIMVERDVEGLLALKASGPTVWAGRQANTPDAVLRARMWAAWRLWWPAVEATLSALPVNSGYEPKLMNRIREHLQVSPALEPERQRLRLLLLLQEEFRIRQERRR